MYRTNNCGELNLSNVGQEVTLAGWVQKARKMGGMVFIDLRERFGITQLVFEEDTNAELCEKAENMREACRMRALLYNKYDRFGEYLNLYEESINHYDNL